MNMRISSESEMLAFGRQMAENLTFPAVFELVGDVGAGKTTFTRGLAEGLGISSAVTSPSFTISKRYAFPLSHPENNTSGNLIHYDFYRLDDPGIMREELSEALLLPNAVIVVEWGGGVADLLPANKTRIEFNLTPEGDRELQISAPGKLETVEISDLSPVIKNVGGVSSTTSNKSKKESSICEIYLDTSTNVCRLGINDQTYSWDSGRIMAEQIFTFIHNKLSENNFDWPDITKITYFSGPGSFTGLRIGAAVVNTLADQLQIPLFDHHDVQRPVIIPEYGRPANISAPKK